MRTRKTVLSYVGWLLVFAGIACSGFAVMRWIELRTLTSVEVGGLDAVARIDSGRRTFWKGAAAYELNLSWQTSDGVRRSAAGVPVTRAYAREIVKGDQLVTLAVPIRYHPDQGDTAVAVMPDAARRQASLWNTVTSAAWLAIGSLVMGGALLTWRVWCGRRTAN